MTRRVHNSRGVPIPRSVPSSGFRCLSTVYSASWLHQLVSSGSHVQDFLSRGFSLRAATLPHQEELPSCRSASVDFPSSVRRPAPYSIRGRLDSKAFLRSKMRASGLVFSRPSRRSPHQVFKTSLVSFPANGSARPVRPPCARAQEFVSEDLHPTGSSAWSTRPKPRRPGDALLLCPLLHIFPTTEAVFPTSNCVHVATSLRVRSDRRNGLHSPSARPRCDFAAGSLQPPR